jgi:hypothetical protein
MYSYFKQKHERRIYDVNVNKNKKDIHEGKQVHNQRMVMS